MTDHSRQPPARIDNVRLLTISTTFLGLIALGALLHITQSFMVPFVIAVFLSFLLVPLADSLVRLRIPPVLANVLVLASVVVLLTGLVFLVYAALSSVGDALPRYTQKYSRYMDQAASYLQNNLGISSGLNGGRIEWKQVLGLVSPASIMQAVNEGVEAFVTFLSRLSLMMIFLMFIVSSRKLFINKVHTFISGFRNHSARTVTMISSIGVEIQRYLLLKTLTSIGTGLIFGLTAWGFGLDFAFIWGFLAFLFNYIPTLGPILTSIPPIFLALLQFNTLLWGGLTALSLAAVLFILGSFVEPVIMGEKLNLNIMAILLSLLLWGIIWGVPGMFLAVPITASINIMCANIPSLKDFSILFSK